MHAQRRFGVTVLGLATCALLVAGAGQARAGTMTVDYTTLGSFTTPSLDVGGVKVTGSNTIDVVGGTGQGLGIVGGSADSTVGFQGAESISFFFDAGPATAVQLVTNVVSGDGTANAQFAAFGAGGVPLGTHTIDLFPPNFPTLDVSAIFGNVPISSFTVTPLNTNLFNIETHFTLGSISFTPAAPPPPPPTVPEPSSLALLSLGGIALAGWRRWKKRVTA